MKTVNKIAHLVDARNRCIATGNNEWEAKHSEALTVISNHLPSGSGIDSGSQIDQDASNGNKLVISCSYHHMNDVGMYDGWTNHQVIVTPDLIFGYRIRITGPDRNNVKEYLSEVYREALDAEVSEN